MRYLTGAHYKAMKRKRDEFERLFLQVIERGIEQRVFRDDLDPRIVGLGLFGICAWVHQWYRPGGRFSAEQVADIFCEMALEGLLVQRRSLGRNGKRD
jgi:hypothetical protein